MSPREQNAEKVLREHLKEGFDILMSESVDEGVRLYIKRRDGKEEMWFISELRQVTQES